MVDHVGVYLLFQGLSIFAIKKDLPVELGTHHCLEVNKLIRFSWVRFFCLFLGTHFKQPGFHAKMTSRDKKPPTISLFSLQFHMWWVFEKITRAFGCNLLKSGESLKSSSLPTLWSWFSSVSGVQSYMNLQSAAWCSQCWNLWWWSRFLQP